MSKGSYRVQVSLIGLIVLVGLSLTIWIAHEFADQQSTFILEQGTWTPTEAERHITKLSSVVRLIAAGEPVSEEEYTLLHELTLGFVTSLRAFEHNNPTFTEEQRQLVGDLEHDTQQYEQLVGTGPPNRVQARQVANLLEHSVRQSHRLTNLRRQVAEEGTTRSLQIAQLAQVVQLATVGMLLLAGWRFYHLLQQSHRKDLVIAQLQKEAAEAATTRLRASLVQAEDLAVEQERMRVAHEIHDGLGHHLNIMKIHMAVALRCFRTDPTSAEESLQIAKVETTAALHELRRAIEALRGDHLARPLEELLAASVRDCELAGVTTTLEIVGVAPLLPEQIKHTLYRIGQEAATNIRKHACSSHARLVMDYHEPGWVRMQIEDDGVGIDTVARRKGHGLNNLIERTTLIGGTITIDSQVGRGVTICVTVPLLP